MNAISILLIKVFRGNTSSLCSPVAQLVEQVAVNHSVIGSNPIRGAIFYIKMFLKNKPQINLFEV